MMRTMTAFSLALSSVHAQEARPNRRVLGGDDSTGRLAIVAPDGKLDWEIKVSVIHDARYTWVASMMQPRANRSPSDRHRSAWMS